MLRGLPLVLLTLASGCPRKPTTAPAGGGQGSGSGGGASATRCIDVKTKVETLYRAEAQAREPTRVEQAVADNTAMVMADCEANTASFVPCLTRAQSVSEIEKNCLVPLDDSGAEAER